MPNHDKLVILEHCSVDRCRMTVHCKSLCGMHYQRLKNHGDPMFTKRKSPTGQTRTITPVLDLDGLPVLSYKGVHNRLRRERGRAANYICACGRHAHDWALPHDLATDRVIWERGRKFTRDLWAYVPLCRSCHLSGDRQHRREAMA